MSGSEVDEDRMVVYTTTTVDASPKEFDAETLAEEYPDANHVTVNDRVTGDYAAEIGADPAYHVCPQCSEETWTATTVDGVRYYNHHENEQCELDTSNAPEDGGRNTHEPSTNRKLANIAVGAGVSLAAARVAVEVVAKVPFSVNGEPVNADPATTFPTVAALVLLITLIVAVIQIGPRPIGGGRR